MLVSRLFALALCAVVALPAAAHEFWISPETYQVAPGSAIRADFRNGEEFKGNALSFFDRSSTRFETGFGGDIIAVEPRAGDSPALQITAPDKDGLLVVVHETTASRLTYKTWEKFAKFAAHKDFPTADADHAAAGWPRENFRESYSRHVKSLIAVGDGMGADQQFGLATEFVALSNPYAPGFEGLMEVALYHDGAPRADAQVEVFDRAPDGTVTITLHRTDAMGVARIPVTPGHDYLFDAVVLQPFKGDGGGDRPTVWETLWAALTFHVPG